MFISNAYAQAAAPAGAESLFASPMFMLIIMGVMLLLMILPQRKAAKERKAMMDALAKGDEVVAAGGMLGKINKIADAYIVLEIANGTEIIVQKSAISMLLPKGTMKSV